MANRRQRAARRLEEKDQEQGQEVQVEEQAREPIADKEPIASPPAGKPKSARKMFLILWGIPLVIFIVIAIFKG